MSTLVASEQRVIKYALVVIVNRRQLPALNWNGIIHRMIEIQIKYSGIWPPSKKNSLFNILTYLIYSAVGFRPDHKVELRFIFFLKFDILKGVPRQCEAVGPLFFRLKKGTTHACLCSLRRAMG